jgi:hypothetical protein
MIAAERNGMFKTMKDLALTEGSDLTAEKPMAAEGK